MSNDTPMPRRKVVVAETIAEAGIVTLKAEYDVVDLVGADRSTVLASLGDAAALIVRSATQMRDSNDDGDNRKRIEFGPDRSPVSLFQDTDDRTIRDRLFAELSGETGSSGETGRTTDWV